MGVNHLGFVLTGRIYISDIKQALIDVNQLQYKRP